MKARKSRAALRDATRPGQAKSSAQGDHDPLAVVTDRSRLQWALEAYVRSTRALIHFKGVEELVDQVCEAIVQDGRYLIAAVGLTASAKDQPVRIISAAGVATGYVEGLQLSASSTAVSGSGPTGHSMRSGKPYVMRDALIDPMFEPWRERAAGYGIRSSVTVPLSINGELRGVLLVYAREPDAFGDQELGLFEELAGELSFALSVSDDRSRLASAARDYKLLADHSSDIIIRFSLDDRVLYVSPSVAQLGYAPEEIVDRSPLCLVHPDDRDLASARVSELACDPEDSAAPLRVRLRHANGAWLWFEGSPQLVRDDEGSAGEGVVTLRDITERRAMERELRRRQGEAEAGIRAKSEFLANMSHEIRTPLTAIVGFADLLRESATLQATERGYANRIAVAAQSLQTMVDQILDFSNVDAGRIELDPQPFDPAGLGATVVDMFLDVARAKGVDLSATAPNGLPPAVVADSGRIRQVLLNIVDNALKFTERGAVTIAITHDHEAGGTLRFAVRDSGIGIPAERAAQLFERFSQLDGSVTRRHGGTGLGLAICRSLVERMGGQIGYSSQPGAGSTFWFAVPAPIAAPAATAQAETAPEPESPQRPRVLIVDDAPVNCELVGAMLEAAGYEVTFAYDGAEAVETAGAATYDLILMDMQMPVMDGPSAARAIRGAGGPNADTPIVAVSANVLPMHVHACLEAGMDDHIPKPIATHTLMTKVSHWVGRAHAA
ncbi:ATP-binding protein [Phenylobacterium kunshanense]|uniref:histidine kinase n=1 Tax=Phenylobacterium kunshanense TaxID=1445034 RepID=A0A328BAR6_9CAUL|nr:ATP-binding protein [Phenylobacterium kunshanense]RAK62138.1 hybrid sensor histidine kinase/response regulator [Phenylobacterium kunshanense]